MTKFTEIELAEANRTIGEFIEYYYNEVNKPPSMVRLKNDYPLLTETEIRASLNATLKRLEAKGHNVQKLDYLSPKQLAVANAMLNPADRRSNKKKLDDFEVSSAMFANWKRSPVFNGYMRARAEELLGNSIADVHLALIDSASAGDTTAIKLFYELTGRYSPGSQQIENIKATLTRVIESVQKHVKDPEIIKAIASDIQLTVSTFENEVIRGELDH